MPHVTVKKLSFLLHTLETLGSNLSPNIDYLDPNIHSFLQSLLTIWDSTSNYVVTLSFHTLSTVHYSSFHSNYTVWTINSFININKLTSVSFKTLAALSLGKDPLVPMAHEATWAPDLQWMLCRREKFLPLPRTKHQFFGCPACSLATVPTELTQL